MKTRLLTDIRALWTDRRGNFALITALCAVPMLGMMGLAIDYAVLLANKSKLDAAADAAAVSAVVKARAVLTAGGTLCDAKSQGEAQGRAAFAANDGTVSFGTSGTPVSSDVAIAVKCIAGIPISGNTGQSLTASATYSMTSYSQFGKIFDIGTYSISGSSNSSTVLTPYYQFIFVVDVSNSMAVGGTTGDISNLENDPYVTAHSLNNERCAFACHNQEGAPANGPFPNDLREYARNKHWKLKIDYVNSAVTQFITDLEKQTDGVVPGYFSVGIQTFGTNVNVLQAPVNPPKLALAAAASIDVELSDASNNHGYTDTTAGLTAALNSIKNVGDGSSATSQATYVIFVSDGIEDTSSPGAQWGRRTDISYGPTCASLKQKGVTLVTIEATYSSISNSIVDDQQYDKLVAPLSAPNTPNMQTVMQACATDPTWAYQANDGPGINSAVSAILQRVLQGLTRILN